MRISDWSSDVCSSDLLRWCRVCPPPKTQAWRNPHRMTTMIADLLQSAGHGRGNKPEPGIADWLESWHIDIWLLLLLLAVAIVGIFIQYSATDHSIEGVVSQAQRVVLGLIVMAAIAQAPPDMYRTVRQEEQTSE